MSSGDSTDDSSDDTLRRFLFEQEEISGSIVRLNETWQRLLSADDYPESARAVMGEALAATALLGRNLKFDGRLTLQMQAGAHLRLLILQCDNELKMRGLAQFGDTIPTSFTGLVDGGSLCVTVESGKKSERYQSIVPLSEINFADCLRLYFEKSVQLPTLFMLAADDDQAVGLMLQALPERTPGSKAWQNITDSLRDLDILLMSRVEDEALLSALFPDYDIRLFDSEKVQFSCDCSDERIENMLKILGEDELRELVAQQDPVEIRCEFCNHLYTLPAEKIYALIASIGGDNTKSLH
jgi:molecular chaperone Hsp33